MTKDKSKLKRKRGDGSYPSMFLQLLSLKNLFGLKNGGNSIYCVNVSRIFIMSYSHTSWES
jgi:hypothetical protein